jgi:hypothetical protein
MACAMGMRGNEEAALQLLQDLFARHPKWVGIVKARPEYFGKLLDEPCSRALADAGLTLRRPPAVKRQTTPCTTQ